MCYINRKILEFIFEQILSTNKKLNRTTKKKIFYKCLDGLDV